MKFVPTAISRTIAKQGLLASENAPKILFVGGVVGMVGSTVLACRATLKLETTLDEIEFEKIKHRQMYEYVEEGKAEEGTTYSPEELQKDLRSITVKGARDVAKLYAPAVVLGGLSIAALSKSHNLLQDRNLALTAAYAAVDGAYNRYRERVVERFGPEVDRELVYETEEVEILDPETGKMLSTTRVIDAPGSPYKRWWSRETTRICSPDPDVNLMILRNVQNWANDRLRARGHLVLNDVYSELGLSHTKAGFIVGWRWDKESGDDYVDFGWDLNKENVEAFFRGDDDALLLDFNVDGPIFDKVEETEI